MAANPTNPQSWNRYAYVLNNPLIATDPLGLDCVYQNEDGGVAGVGEGDCDNSIYGGNGYYVNCDGCLFDGSSTNPLQYSIDPITGDLTFSNGSMIQGFADPFMVYETITVTSDAVAANNGTLPNGDVPIYGLMGHGADILAAAGQQASHDLGCAGMGWAVQGGSVAASGAVLSTGTKLGGATSGTSVASATARTIGVSVPRAPTPVGIPFTESFAWRSSSTLGGVLGRWLPYIGTAVSAYLFNSCVDQHP